MAYKFSLNGIEVTCDTVDELKAATAPAAKPKYEPWDKTPRSAPERCFGPRKVIRDGVIKHLFAEGKTIDMIALIEIDGRTWGTSTIKRALGLF